MGKKSTASKKSPSTSSTPPQSKSSKSTKTTPTNTKPKPKSSSKRARAMTFISDDDDTSSSEEILTTTTNTSLAETDKSPTTVTVTDSSPKLQMEYEYSEEDTSDDELWDRDDEQDTSADDEDFVVDEDVSQKEIDKLVKSQKRPLKSCYYSHDYNNVSERLQMEVEYEEEEEGSGEDVAWERESEDYSEDDDEFVVDEDVTEKELEKLVKSQLRPLKNTDIKNENDVELSETVVEEEVGHEDKKEEAEVEKEEAMEMKEGAEVTLGDGEEKDQGEGENEEGGKEENCEGKDKGDGGIDLEMLPLSERLKTINIDTQESVVDQGEKDKEKEVGDDAEEKEEGDEQDGAEKKNVQKESAQGELECPVNDVAEEDEGEEEKHEGYVIEMEKDDRDVVVAEEEKLEGGQKDDDGDIQIKQKSPCPSSSLKGDEDGGIELDLKEIDEKVSEVEEKKGEEEDEEEFIQWVPVLERGDKVREDKSDERMEEVCQKESVSQEKVQDVLLEDVVDDKISKQMEDQVTIEETGMEGDKSPRGVGEQDSQDNNLEVETISAEAQPTVEEATKELSKNSEQEKVKAVIQVQSKTAAATETIATGPQSTLVTVSKKRPLPCEVEDDGKGDGDAILVPFKRLRQGKDEDLTKLYPFVFGEAQSVASRAWPIKELHYGVRPHLTTLDDAALQLLDDKWRAVQAKEASLLADKLEVAAQEFRMMEKALMNR